MAKRIQVGGRIESKEVGGIVTGAAEILDDAKEKKQSVINQETDDELARLDQSKQDNLTFDNAPTEGSDNPVKSGGVYAADKALSDAIEAILLLIPSAASALNKLVDTSMMNSSISTATATFRGTYNVVTDLGIAIDATHEQIAVALGNAISTADNNDYAFVQVPVSAESTDIRRTERYKFNGTAWGYEYDLNTSGFTAAQWAAINSGITIALVGKLIGLPTSSELQALLGQKQDTLTFDNVPTAGSANPVKSGGVHTAINDEKTAREQLANTVTGIDGRVGNIEKVIPTGAADNNKLVVNNSMEAYVTSIIGAITASFTIATADGHINLKLTQTNGRVASLTLTSSDIASAQALTALTGRVTTAEGNITSLGGRVSTNETDIANLQQLYNGLQQSNPEPVTALPETGQQQGVIYRLAGTTSYSDYMWNGSTWVLMATYNNAIDPRPKKASQNLVTSGGVFDNMGALDVSEFNATENPHTLAQYVDLSAALAAIPTDYQKGGMSIKFVQSSDNKYVQFRLMLSTFTASQFANTVNWQGIENEPISGSDNLVDSNGIYNVKRDALFKPVSGLAYEITPNTEETDTIYYADGTTATLSGYTAKKYQLAKGTVVKITISKTYTNSTYAIIAYKDSNNNFYPILRGPFRYYNNNDIYLTITPDMSELIVVCGNLVGIDTHYENYSDAFFTEKKVGYYVKNTNEEAELTAYTLYYFDVTSIEKAYLYVATGGSSAYCLFVDNNNNIVGTPFKTGYSSIWKELSIPEGAVILKVSSLNPSNNYQDAKPCKLLLYQSNIDSIQESENAIKKTMVNVGMSIWYYDGGTYGNANTIDGEGTICKGYQTLLEQVFTFAKVVKYAYSGYSLGVGDNSSHSIMSTKASTWVANENAIWTLDTITNDFQRNVPLGVPSDFDNATGINTFYGALRAFKDRVAELTTNPIIVCSNALFRTYGNAQNGLGLTLEDYEKAMCYAAAKSGWYFVDQYRNSVNEVNADVALYDGLHLTNFGYRLAVKPWVEQFYIIQKSLLK